MKLNFAPILLATAFCTWTASHLRADDKDIVSPGTSSPATDKIQFSQEFLLENSYSGGAETKQGNAKLGNVANINSHFDYVISPQIKDGFLLRVGVDAERNSFGLPAHAPLPNTLQSVNAIIGVDVAVKDKILLRAELHPGIYSDFVNVTGSDFDMPVQFGGTYLFSKDFQVILGGQIDLKSDIPFIIAPGIRWQFADKWVLAAYAPKPQIQYQLSNALTLYSGAEILDGTYHLNDNFGSSSDLKPGANYRQLNGNIVDFTEVRVGAGATWKFTPNLSLDVSGGYMVYRSFDIHADHIGYNTSGTTFHNNISDGAPYGEIGISGSF